MVHLWGLLLAPGLMGHLGTLRVEAETPDAFCPAPHVLEQVVRERLGELEDDFTLRYTVTRNISRGETTLQIVLLSSGGEVVLQRKVPLGPDGCDGAALLITHVLEAHLLEREATPELAAGSVAPNDPTPGANGEPTPRVEMPREAPATPKPGAYYPRENEGLRQFQLREGTPIGATHSGDQRTRRPSTELDPRSLKPRASAGVGVGVTFQGGSTLTLEGRVPTGDDRWSVHLSLAVPLAATSTVDGTLGLEIHSVSPGGAAELSYRVIHKHATSLFLSVGFIGFAQVAWIDDSPSSGIRSSGAQTRFLGAPTAGVALAYVLVPNWEVNFNVLGGPTPVSTLTFAFAPSPGMPPGEEVVAVLEPSPVVGLAALAFSHRF
jgi:hypothetical protein